MSTKDLKEKGTHFLLLTGSTLLMAVGTYFFKFTNNFTFGGITGLAVLIAKTGVMSAGDFNLIASMILLLIGMIILGRKFAATTAYCSILLSVTLSLLERICPMTQPLTDQPMLLNYALRSHFPHLDLPFFLILVRPVAEPTLLP